MQTTKKKYLYCFSRKPISCIRSMLFLAVFAVALGGCSYDFDAKAISYVLLKEDSNAMLYAFFEHGTLIQINDDGSVRTSK